MPDAPLLAKDKLSAFGFSLAHGSEHGHEIEDWFRAEHEVMWWPAAELAEVNADAIWK
jgi:hypothetical protein